MLYKYVTLSTKPYPGTTLIIALNSVNCNTGSGHMNRAASVPHIYVPLKIIVILHER